jgi:hypothetical protein
MASNATQRYGIDTTAGTQRYLGDQAVGAQRYGIDQNTGTQRYLGDQSAGTARYLGDQTAGTQRYGIDTTAGTARYLGDQNNATSRYGIDTSAGTARYGVDANTGVQNRGLDVTMRGQDINWQNNNNNYQLQSEANRNGFYTAQRGQDLQGLQIGGNLYQQGVMGPWGPLQAAGGVYGPYTGNGTTTGTNSQGGGWLGRPRWRRCGLPACEELRMDLRSTR